MQGLAHYDEEEQSGEPWEVRIAQDWRAIQYAPESFKQDRACMLKLVRVSGYAFEFADEELLEDKKLALEAVRHSYGDALQWAPKELHRDRAFMLSCIDVSEAVMRMVSNKAYNDEEAKVKSTGGVFYCYRRGGKDGVPFPAGACTPQTGAQCASCQRFLDDPDNCPLPQDREFMKNALERNWKMLKYADKELKGEKDIVMAAVASGGWAIQFADAALQADKDVALAAVKQNWKVFTQLARQLRADRDVARAAAEQDWHSLKYFAKELKNDMELAWIAVKQSWQSFEFLSKELRGKRDLAVDAVRQDWHAFQHVSKALKSDKELALIAVRQDGAALALAPPDLQSDAEVAAAAVRQDWRSLAHAGPELKADEALVMEAVQANGFALRLAAEDLKCREPLVAAAMQQQWAALDVAVNPRFYEEDGLDFEFWKSFSEQSGIRGKLRPAIPIGT